MNTVTHLAQVSPQSDACRAEKGTTRIRVVRRVRPAPAELAAGEIPDPVRNDEVEDSDTNGRPVFIGAIKETHSRRELMQEHAIGNERSVPLPPSRPGAAVKGSPTSTQPMSSSRAEPPDSRAATSNNVSFGGDRTEPSDSQLGLLHAEPARGRDSAPGRSYAL